jgi:hypothetical protein
LFFAKKGVDTTVSTSTCLHYLEDDKFRSSGELRRRRRRRRKSVALWIQSAKPVPSSSTLPPSSLHHQIK